MDTCVEEEKVLTIPSNSYFRIKDVNSPESEPFADALLIPDDPNMESIDGAFLDGAEKILYMFQITIRKTHPVNCDGLVKLVEMMQMTEAITKGEIEPRLVFIVLEENEGSFSKQTIKDVSFVMSDKFVPETALEFGAIKGLRQASIDKLINSGVKTLGDLKELFETGKVKYKAVEQFFKPRNLDLIIKLREVNQLVTSLKFPADDKLEIGEVKE
jgi:hypothetical protein